MVCPSGSARATSKAPIEPEAPGWFTTTKRWPSASSKSVATMRAIWSVEPPAAQGTMRVTGRSGRQG